MSLLHCPYTLPTGTEKDVRRTMTDQEWLSTVVVEDTDHNSCSEEGQAANDTDGCQTS